METITFQGIDYPARYIANGALISTTDLGDILEPVYEDDIEAVYLDHDICGYVSREELDLPKKELEKICRDYDIIE